MAGRERSVPPGLRITNSTKDTGDSSVPPGWDENPTAWPRRIALAGIALVGFMVAGYLTLYQLHVFSRVWDPFFPRGTPIVTHLTDPFPDAILGVLAYGTEIALSFIGGSDRWRTMPWTAIGFGLVVASGAVVSVFLMIVQPTVAHAWCTLCLVSAGISLVLFGWGADEALAGMQHLKRVRASGGSIWRAFWGREDLDALSGASTEGRE